MMNSRSLTVMLMIIFTGCFSFADRIVNPNSQMLKKYQYKTSFTETYERYPSPKDFTMKIYSIFGIKSGIYENCLTINDENIKIYGGNDPMKLAPATQEPGAFFMDYYYNCIQNVGLSFFSYSSIESVFVWIESIVSSPYKLFENSNICSGEEYYLRNKLSCIESLRTSNNIIINKKWKSLDVKLRTQILVNLMHKVVGPEKLLNWMGYIG
ncbi:MAG TPA: hypothetical protein PLJ21_10140, partial [Pseudobdellovibrionaceae bacterium]|nr:hypothetical protein [Pseudobdellovibrionaceae bacterium]